MADTFAVAVACGVRPQVIRTWAARYPHELPRRGYDPRGRTLFAVEEAQALARRLRPGQGCDTIPCQVGFAMPAAREAP